MFSLKWKKPEGSGQMAWFPSMIHVTVYYRRKPEAAAFADYTQNIS